MSRRTVSCLILVCFSLGIASLDACEIRVRDSAFRIARDVHKLCVIAQSTDETADVLVQRLNEWLEETDSTFNLEVVRIDADDPETNWQSVGIPSAPSILPVTVLVGRNNGIGESFIIDHWQGTPTQEELSALVDSPIRRQLAHELARNIAVLIYAPGDC